MNHDHGFFVIDGLGGPYAGYTDGSFWNGWACPVFGRAAADQIAEDFRAQGKRDGQSGHYDAHFDSEADAFLFSDPDDDPADGPLVFESDTVTVGGAQVVVYPVGTRYWTWEAAVQETGSEGL